MIDDDAEEIYNLENSLRSICGTTFVYADIDAAKAFFAKNITISTRSKLLQFKMPH